MKPALRRLARIAAVQLLAGLVWLLPLTYKPSGIPFWRGGEYSDLLISHWPNAWFIHRSLSEWRQLPLWNPTILAGAPFAADPLSGMWYPPNWLAVLFPHAWAFNLLLWVHLACAGTGMWLLLRRMGLTPAAALVGSLAFAGTPKLVGHIGLGHLGLVSAVSWTPWVLLAAHAAAAAPPAGRGPRLRQAAMWGGALAAAFLADPRWFLPLCMLSFTAATAWTAHSHQGNRDWWRILGVHCATAAAFALAVAAVLALPLLEFAAHSTRADLNPLDSAGDGLPLARILGLVAPDLGGWPEWQGYVGITVLALGLVAVWSRAGGAGLWAGIVIGCLLLALGNATPAHAVMVRLLPGYSLLRVPARWLFGAAFGTAVLAALGLDRLLDRPFAGRGRLGFNLTLFGLLLLMGGLGAAIGATAADSAGERALSFVLSAAWLGAVILWMAFVPRLALPARWLALGWAAMVVLDLGLVDFSEIESRPISAGQNPTVAAVVSHVSPDLAGRAFSPSYSLPQPDAAMAGLELADGINPLQLRELRDYLAAATGFQTAGYSVTLPPFAQGDPKIPWGVRPDAAMLGRLSVAYLASAYPIQQEGWGFVGVDGGAYLYRNAFARPRAWVELDGPDGPWRAVTDLQWSPNRIRLQAEGPGLLVLSEIAYPGWLVRVNARQAAWETGREPFRAVRLPAGPQQVELIFRPWTVYVGAGITLIGLAALAALWMVRR